METQAPHPEPSAEAADNLRDRERALRRQLWRLSQLRLEKKGASLYAIFGPRGRVTFGSDAPWLFTLDQLEVIMAEFRKLLTQ